MNKPATAPPRSFPALVQQFFTEYLVAQRAVSPRTVACYRDALSLFLGFASHKLGKAPTAMQLAGMRPELILAFLDHLEQGRKNAVRSRNLRLTALRAFLKFAARRDVMALHDIERALAVPMKRFERPMLGFLTRPEMLAVLGQPGANWSSQRDHLLLAMLYNTGARVSEMIGVRVVDVILDGGACVHLHGKGRKLRSIPLWKSTVIEIRAWLQIERHAAPAPCSDPRNGAATQSRHKARLASHAQAHERHAPAAVGRAVQRDRLVAWPREHDYDPSICRGRPGDEGEGARTPGGARHQDGPLQGAGLAPAIPANAVTMRRPRRAECLIAAGAGAVHAKAPVHSGDMCIGVACRALHSDPKPTCKRQSSTPESRLFGRACR